MKFFRLDLLTLLISLFILNSCKNENTIGLPEGASGIGGSLVDTATIYAQTFKEDSVETSSITNTPLGYLIDPIFGTTESDLITDLNIPGGGTTYTIPTGLITIDSALLKLRYSPGFYGDSLSNYTVNVYQLSERLFSGQPYYDNMQWGHNSTIIGTKTFQPRPGSKVRFFDIVDGGIDTGKNFPSQIRIPINANFISSYLFSGVTGTGISNLVFKNNIKGFFVSVDKAQTTGIGGTIMLYADSSSVDVYVRVKNGSVTDTAIVTLPIVQHAAEVNRIFTTQIQNALKRTAVSDSLIYLQGTAGLKSKISFPFIDSLFSVKNIGRNSKVIINRAEIVVTAAQEANDIPLYLSPLPKLTLYRYDIAHQPSQVEDALNSFAAFQVGQFYNSTSRSYHFLVTSYIQNLVNKRTTDYGTFIAPTDIDSNNTTSVDIAPTIQTAGRTIVLGPNNLSKYRMKLNVIYTKTNK